jgi:uncharacterized membrane protein YcaP (DUF421 family)
VHLAGIVARTLTVYLAILLALRLGGRRELGQLTPFDLVVVLLVANAVQNAMVGPDTSLAGGLVSAAVLIGANRVVARLRYRHRRLRDLVEGTPVVLVQHGEYVTANLHREAVTEDEVLAAVREHGDVGTIEDVELAVLEADGSLSVVPASSDVHRTRRRLRQRHHT